MKVLLVEPFHTDSLLNTSHNFPSNTSSHELCPLKKQIIIMEFFADTYFIFQAENVISFISLHVYDLIHVWLSTLKLSSMNTYIDSKMSGTCKVIQDSESNKCL